MPTKFRLRTNHTCYQKPKSISLDSPFKSCLFFTWPSIFQLALGGLLRRTKLVSSEDLPVRCICWNIDSTENTHNTWQNVKNPINEKLSGDSNRWLHEKLSSNILLTASVATQQDNCRAWRTFPVHPKGLTNKVAYIILPVLRIRIRDPVPFWPWTRILDPGSGIGFFPDPGARIPTPYFLELSDKFLGKKFYNSLKTGSNFFFSI